MPVDRHEGSACSFVVREHRGPVGRGRAERTCDAGLHGINERLPTRHGSGLESPSPPMFHDGLLTRLCCVAGGIARAYSVAYPGTNVEVQTDTATTRALLLMRAMLPMLHRQPRLGLTGMHVEGGSSTRPPPCRCRPWICQSWKTGARAARTVARPPVWEALRDLSRDGGVTVVLTCQPTRPITTPDAPDRGHGAVSLACTRLFVEQLHGKTMFSSTSVVRDAVVATASSSHHAKAKVKQVWSAQLSKSFWQGQAPTPTVDLQTPSSLPPQTSTLAPRWTGRQMPVRKRLRAPRRHGRFAPMCKGPRSNDDREHRAQALTSLTCSSGREPRRGKS